MSPTELSPWRSTRSTLIRPWAAKADTAVWAELVTTEVRGVAVASPDLAAMVDQVLNPTTIARSSGNPELAVTEEMAAWAVLAVAAVAVQPVEPAGMAGRLRGVVCMSPAGRSPSRLILSAVIPPWVVRGLSEVWVVSVEPAAKVVLGSSVAPLVEAVTSTGRTDLVNVAALMVV